MNTKKEFQAYGNAVTRIPYISGSPLSCPIATCPKTTILFPTTLARNEHYFYRHILNPSSPYPPRKHNKPNISVPGNPLRCPRCSKREFPTKNRRDWHYFQAHVIRAKLLPKEVRDLDDGLVKNNGEMNDGPLGKGMHFLEVERYCEEPESYVDDEDGEATQEGVKVETSPGNTRER